MEWEARINGSIGARAWPVRSLEIPFQVVWRGMGDVELEVVECFGHFPDYAGLDLPLVEVPVGLGWLSGGTPGSEASVLIRYEIDARFIQELEERRNGTGPVKMLLNLNVHFRKLEIHQFAADPSTRQQEPITIRSVSHPLRQQVQVMLAIQRDQWLNLLTALQWDEFQVFEVAVRSMNRIQGFQKALGHLQAAQVAFRQGQWSVTVTEARKACEAAAREVQTGAAADPGPAFENLMTHILPADADKPKRKALNHFMMGLAQLRHPGAHGHSETEIGRAEAELALTIAVSLFRYIGEVTAKRA